MRKIGTYLTGFISMVSGLLVLWRFRPRRPESPPPQPIATPEQTPIMPESVPEIPQRPTLFQRISRLYQTIALITFNAALLLIVLLLIAGKLLPGNFTRAARLGITPVNWGAVGVNVRYSQTFERDSYLFMQNEEIDQLGFEYDSLAAEGHWQVNPWTGLTLRPFKGRWLNTDSDGFRVTTPPAPEYADKPPLTVWAFGGSTLFGWGLADDYAPPSRLQVELQTRFPDRQVRVSNFGIPWYYSSQEAALFINNLRRLDTPDIAIFLDGLNEVQYLVREDNQLPLIPPLALAWEDQIADFTHPNDQPWVAFNPSFPPNRIARQLGIHLYNPKMGYRGVRYAQPSIGAWEVEDRLPIALHDYLANRRMITAVGQSYDVALYFLLQPLPSWKDNANYNTFREGLLQNHDSADFYDITNTFDAVDPETILLVDKTHYSDMASQILAEHIANIIADSSAG